MNNKQLKNKYKGCWGVGEGKKIENGKKTNRDAILFFVNEKKPENEIPKNQLIPKKIDGVETDVIADDMPTLLDLTDPIKRRTSVRPLIGGISVGCAYSTAGTLAIAFDNKGQKETISNAHVIAPHWKGAKINHPIIQPGWVDDTFAIIGYLKKYQQILWNKPNKVDYGKALINDDVEVKSLEIVGIGKVKPIIRRMEVGDIMLSTGRTTGPAEEEVTAVNVSLSVNMGGESGITQWEDQVIFDNVRNFVLPGDSGSLVVHKKDNVIGGLIFAGSEKRGIANQAVNILAIDPDLPFDIEGQERKYYVSAGKEWYIEPPLGKTKTIVRLNLRTEPRVHSSNFIRTMPVGTEIEIIKNIGKINDYFWLEIKI